MTAIADDHRTLPIPLPKEEVNTILHHGRICPIILRHNEDERSMSLDLGAPRPGVRVRVVRRVGDLGRDEGLVEEGQVPGREVDEVQVGSGSGSGSSRGRCGVRVQRGGGGIVGAALNGFGHVGRYLRTDAWLARGTDDDPYGRRSDGRHGERVRA